MKEQKKHTKIMLGWTIAWVLSLAFLSGGENSLWDSLLITKIGLIINLAIGIGMIFISYKLIWLLAVISIALIIPFIAVTARRLHDINKSGWFQLLSVPAGILEAAFHAQKGLEILFMIIGWGCGLYLFVLYIQEGDKKSNRFGENPLKIK